MREAILIVERLIGDTNDWIRQHRTAGRRIDVAGAQIRLKALLDTLVELHKAQPSGKLPHIYALVVDFERAVEERTSFEESGYGEADGQRTAKALEEARAALAKALGEALS